MTRRPQPPLLYTDYPHSPMPRRLHFGRWHWEIRDAATGPILAEGDTRTRRGAMRQREKSRVRCVRRHHIVNISHPPLHPLTAAEVASVAFDLAAEGVPVEPVVVHGEVELCPLAELDTWQRVAALRAVIRRTDAPVHWRRAVVR